MELLLTIFAIGLGLYFFNWVWKEWGKLFKVQPPTQVQVFDSKEFDQDWHDNLNY